MSLSRILSLTALFLVLFSSVALCDVGGGIELDYGHYESEEGGVTESDMSHFAQRYELFVFRKGLFMDGRAGDYNLMLGGEWLALDSDVVINGVNHDYSVSSGKLLYRGEVIFAPGGLPFRLNAYARDIAASQFEEDTFFNPGWMDEYTLAPQRSSVLDSNIIGDVIDGNRFEMGASMIIGIKNGGYLGRYRSILSSLPKLYVDYRETRVQDLESRTPEDYVDRELAFVSLNKKNNWFHYRFMDHRDKYNPLLDSEILTYMLGTVNQSMRREWINLTNWIQLSVDASYTTELNPNISDVDENRYSINLFTKTERRNWSSSIFSRFWRWEKAAELERFAQIPVYAQGTPDRDNSWRFRFVGTAEKTNRPFAPVNLERDENDLYSKGRWETNKTRRFTVASELEAEKKFGDEGDGWAARSALEYFTNRDARSALNSFASLSLGYFNAVPPTTGTVLDTDLVEAVGRFNIDKQITPRSRTGIESLLLIGSGQSEADVTDYITPMSRTGFFASSVNSDRVVVDGTVWRGRLMWFADHISINRATNRYELAAEYQDDGTSNAGQYLARHIYKYQATPYRINIVSEALYGDELDRSVNSRAFGAVLAGSAFDGYSLSNESSIDYSLNRSSKAGGTLTLDYRDPDSSNAGYRVAFRQDYRYTRYASVGVVRRLFELNEFLDYERIDTEVDSFFEAVALTGVGNYYPVSWTRLGGKVRWQHDIDCGDDDVGFGLYTDFTFSLLTVGMEYEYGLRTVDDTGGLLDRTEQRWRISLKKTF